MNDADKQTIQNLFAQATMFESQGDTACARALWHQILVKINYSIECHVALTHSYGNTLENQKALCHAQMAFLIDPTQAATRWLYGLMLFRTSHWQKSLDVLTPLTISDPNWPNLNFVMARLHLERRDMEQSDPYFRKAIANAQGDHIEEHKLRWEHAMQQLTQSNYTEGWQNHESRLISLGWENLNLCPIPAPAWTGEPLAGKTIVVHGEQGLGDEIMYASMLPDLLKQGAKIIFACHSAIQKLMRLSFPDITVIPHLRGPTQVEQWRQGILPDWWNELKQNNTHIDYQIPLGSLANILRTELQAFPRTPYLKIDVAQKKMLQTQLAQRAKEQNIDLNGKKLIALAWCGNLDNPHGRAKSLDLKQLEELGQIAKTHNAVFVSLQSQQYGYQAIEALAQGILPIVDMSPFTNEFDATLALASLCEHIISIDTSYVHLCGGAGLNTLLLLRRNCDWRWGWTKTESDWYNSLELIRQDVDLDWTPVIKKTEQKVQKWLTTS